MHNEKGFSLIELSVVLVIIGLLMAGIISAYSLHLKRQQIVTTKDNLTAAIEAVEAFRAANGYYPCPASGTEPSLIATNCAAAAPAGTKTATTASGQTVRIGVVPISARNKDGNMTQILRGEQVVDGFRNRLAYAVIETMATTPEAYNSAGNGSIIIKNSNNMSGEPFNETARFIIFSHGPDGAGAYTANGALRAPCNMAATDGENCNDDAVFADSGAGARSFTGNNSNFDDFVGTKANPSASPVAGINGSVEFYHSTVEFRNPWGSLTHKCSPHSAGIFTAYCKLVCLNGKPRGIISQGYERTLHGATEGNQVNENPYVTVSTLWACTDAGAGEHGVLLNDGGGLLLNFDGTCDHRIHTTHCNLFKNVYKDL
ncbi:MAG: prepilin-type N-terminal cleavage/methylation domain-containing protein [Micavibrio sp.]